MRRPADSDQHAAVTSAASERRLEASACQQVELPAAGAVAEQGAIAMRRRRSVRPARLRTRAALGPAPGTGAPRASRRDGLSVAPDRRRTFVDLAVRVFRVRSADGVDV